MPKTKTTTKKKTPLRKKKEVKEVKEVEKVDKVEEVKEIEVNDKRYYEGVGRRKTAIARVRLFTSNPDQSVEEGNLVINNKPYKEFFPLLELQRIVESPFSRLKSLNRFRVTIKVKGGGIKGQAEAVRHGISRCLVIFDGNFRKKLKKAGFLTRDPRQKERKKFGLRKARRAPQWTKR